MSSITIRNFDDSPKASLRVRAARHCVAVEQEKKTFCKALWLQTPVKSMVWSLRFASKRKILQRVGACLQQLMKAEKHARAAV
jgi:plasmid stability protein